MRVVTDDEVRAGLFKRRSALGLRPIGVRALLRAPVDIDNRLVNFGVDLFDFIHEVRPVPAAKHAGLSIRCTPRLGVVTLLDHGRIENGNFHPSALEDGGLRRLVKIVSGPDMNHSDGIERIERVEQCLFSIVKTVIVREGDDIRSHFREPLCGRRIRPEGILLSGERCAPAAVGKFVVHHEDIRCPAGVQRLFVKTVFNVSAPLDDGSGSRVPGIKENIPCKGKRDAVRILCGCK